MMRRAPLPKPLPENETKLFDFIVTSVKHLDVTLRVAGGWVRDKMLGKAADDIDITIETPQDRPYISGEQLAHVLSGATKQANHPHVAVIKTNPEKSKHIETAVITIMGHQLEFCHLRKDDYTSCSPIMRTPTVTVATPLEDAQRRDYCCNALFYNLHTREVEDFVGGLEDLQKGVLRCPLEPHETFMDDPLRMLRGIRFSGKLGFRIDPSVTETILFGEEVHEPGFFTHEWKNVAVKPLVWELLRKVSRERYGIECNKMLSGPRPVMCIDNFASHGLLYSAILLEMVPIKSKKGATAEYDRIAMLCPRSMWDEMYEKYTSPLLRFAFFEQQQQQTNNESIPVNTNTNEDAAAASSSPSSTKNTNNNNNKTITPNEVLLSSPSDRVVVSLFGLLAPLLIFHRDRISAEVLGNGKVPVHPSQTPLATQQNPIGRTNSATTKAFTMRDEILKRTEAVVQVGLKLPRKLSEETASLLLALDMLFTQNTGKKMIREVVYNTCINKNDTSNEDAAAADITSIDFSSATPIDFTNDSNSGSSSSSSSPPSLRAALFHSLRGIRNSSLSVTLAFLRVAAMYAFDGQEAPARYFVDSLSSAHKNKSLFRCGELIPLLKGDEILAKTVLPELPKTKLGEALTVQLQFMVDHPDAGKEEVTQHLIQHFGSIGRPSTEVSTAEEK